MYTIYARNTAGSMAPEAMLALCGVDYEVIVLERQADGSFPPSFHAINPRAEVPTLVLPDGSVMTESAAMMIHLADLHPETGLSPPVGSPLRARFLRWQIYLATTVYMSDLRMFYPHRYTMAGGETAGIKAFAKQSIMREFEIYAEALGEGPFILGEKMSAADVYAAMLLSWIPDMPALSGRLPVLGRMYEAVLANPAVKRVWERNGA